MTNKLEQPVSPNQIGEVIPAFEVTPSLLSRAASYVMTSKTNYESQRTRFVEKMAEWDRAYRVELEAESNRAYVGLDDKAAPILHDNSEAIISRLKEAILPVDDDLIVIDSGDVQGQDTELLKYRSKELNAQLEKQDIRIKVDTAIRMAEKFGTCVVKIPMENSQRTVLTRQIVTKQVPVPVLDENGAPVVDENDQPVMQMQPQQSVEIIPEMDLKYFGPGYQVIDNLEDLYVDPLIENIQDQPIIVHRVLTTWEYLMDLVEKKVIMPEQLQKVKGKSFRTSLDWGSNRKVTNSGMGDTVAVSGKPEIYETFYGYCDFAIPMPDGTERAYPCVIIVIGNTTVSLGPNPYFDQLKPFVKGSYRRIEGEFYGEGAIQPVLDLYHEYNDTMNQINDSKVLALNPIKIQKASQAASKQDLDIEPGTTWYEKNTGDIRFAQFDYGPVANGLQYLELLEQRINRGMGISPLILGQGDSTDLDKTWRGTNKIIAQADKKFKSIALDLEDVLIRQWAEFGYKRNLQFNPLIGVDGSFAQINGEVNFEVEGVNSFFERQEKIANMSLFTERVQGIPGMNTLGLIMTAAELLKIEIDPKYGPLYTQPPPPPPEEKPMSTSTTIALDPSKGGFMALAAAQILAQKGIYLNLDAIGEAQNLITFTTPEKVKTESGIMPPQKDSYKKTDPRSDK